MVLNTFLLNEETNKLDILLKRVAVMRNILEVFNVVLIEYTLVIVSIDDGLYFWQLRKRRFFFNIVNC